MSVLFPVQQSRLFHKTMFRRKIEGDSRRTLLLTVSNEKERVAVDAKLHRVLVLLGKI